MASSSASDNEILGETLDSEPLDDETLGGAVAAAPRPTGGARRGRNALWALPATLWILVFLIAPLVMIVLVSLWTRSVNGFDAFNWTFDNYRKIFETSLYTNALWTTIKLSAIVMLISLAAGYPVAYFLALCVKSLKWQISLFVVVLAPFWTAYVIRIIAWIPVLGRQGVINQGLEKVSLIDEPIDWLLYSNFAVVVALVQLYVLFMVTPIFFQLATIDRAAVEGARDLGATPRQVFREVVLPLSLPGVLIGCVFVFVLCMGEFATVGLMGGGKVQSVGLYVRSQYQNIDFPAAAAGSFVLVLVMMVGVAAMLRFAKLRDEV